MKDKLFYLLFGIVLGGLLSASIKYPVSIDEFNRVMVACPEGEFKRFKVSISGEIYELTCKNLKTVDVRKKGEEN